MANFLKFIPKKVICPICYGGVHDYKLSNTKLESLFGNNILPKHLSSEEIFVTAGLFNNIGAQFNFFGRWGWFSDELRLNTRLFVADRSNNSLYTVVDLGRIGRFKQPFGFIFSEEDFEKIIADGEYSVINSKKSENTNTTTSKKEDTETLNSTNSTTATTAKEKETMPENNTSLTTDTTVKEEDTMTENKNNPTTGTTSTTALTTTTASNALPIDFESISKKLGIDIGILHDERISSTIIGTAIKCVDGQYRVYDRQKKQVTTYNDLVTLKLPIIKFAVTSVKEGDTIWYVGEPYCVDSVNDNIVTATNIVNLTKVGIVPNMNPLGVPCYVKLFSLGDLLGFTGENTNNQKILLWVLTMVGQQFFSEGIDNANAKILEYTSKAEKYIQYLVPFAIVAFAGYAMKGESDLSVSNIASTAKKSLGIDLEVLKDKKNLKKILVIGGAAFGTIMFYKNQASKKIAENGEPADVQSIMDKLVATIKPLQASIMKMLPAALAICAVNLLSNDKFDIEDIKNQVTGAFYIAQDVISEKFHLSEDFFSAENLKKVAVLAGIAIAVFIAYGHQTKANQEGQAQADNLVNQILPVITPFLPLLVLVIPAMKKFFADHGQNVELPEGTDTSDESSEEAQTPENVDDGKKQESTDASTDTEDHPTEE